MELCHLFGAVGDALPSCLHLLFGSHFGRQQVGKRSCLKGKLLTWRQSYYAL